MQDAFADQSASMDESLMVNIKEIDHQHQLLFNLIHLLEKSEQSSSNKDLTEGIVDALIDYSFTHFLTEERYMDRFEFPDADFHKKQHSRYRETVMDFKEKIKNGDDVSLDNVVVFLKRWWVNHIQINDMELGVFLNMAGAI